jgi:hypothetical protein
VAVEYTAEIVQLCSSFRTGVQRVNGESEGARKDFRVTRCIFPSA